MNLYFITGNKNKFIEAQDIIPKLKQLRLDLPEIQEINPKKIIEHKLQEARKVRTGQFLVEDSSLYMDCLDGLPGPLIKWFLQTVGIEGIYKIAKKFRNYSATAEVMIGYADSRGKIRYFSGKISGTIVAPKGKTSFGWDPIFQPTGHTKTFAQMSAEEKGAISHRGVAFRKVARAL